MSYIIILNIKYYIYIIIFKVVEDFLVLNYLRVLYLSPCNANTY